MIAVIKTGGKQYVVQEGDVLTVEMLAAEQGAKVSFDVLLMAEADGSKVDLGEPMLSKTIEAEVVAHGRAKKIEVVKYKAKSRYRRRVGHRQPFTKVKIGKIA
ncbi:MAG: 50S ribosomal protein L21 [Patescibacteria group bacterium]|jgi:large subunit ribosomal protein L21